MRCEDCGRMVLWGEPSGGGYLTRCGCGDLVRTADGARVVVAPTAAGLDLTRPTRELCAETGLDRRAIAAARRAAGVVVPRGRRPGQPRAGWLAPEVAGALLDGWRRAIRRRSDVALATRLGVLPAVLAMARAHGVAEGTAREWSARVRA